MPTVKITNVELGKILAFGEQGSTQREISLKLDHTQFAISRAVKKHKKYGSIMHLGENGRAAVVSEEIYKLFMSFWQRSLKYRSDKLQKKEY